jgi:hypothetical protein
MASPKKSALLWHFVDNKDLMPTRLNADVSQGSIVADGSQQLRNERAGRCGVRCKSVAKRALRA